MEKGMARVTILLLNYNRPNDTNECINSLRGIESPEYNILLLDNNSPDNSFEIFQNKFPDLEIINTGSNLGYTGGINFGLKILAARNSDYILVLNNDTIVEPDFLEHLVDSMEENKLAAAACGTILCEHNREEIWYAGGAMVEWRGLAVHNGKGKKFTEYIKVHSPQKTSFVTGCSILFRRSILTKIGFEDERFYMYLDDIEYSKRIKKLGFELLYVPRSIIYHKVLGEKDSPFKLYYSVRNRYLLIKSSFQGTNYVIANLYFSIVIFLKIVYWKFRNPIFFKAAIAGLQDYRKKNFGKGRGHEFFNI
ncbi:MAG: glycosyltransferase family 2 protein [Bacteroidota bacterium]